MDNTVAAIVVTYNRCDLLIESVQALLTQSRTPDRVYIVNNASTDGTLERLNIEGVTGRPQIVLINLPANIGCAGGFQAGVERALEDRFQWIWMMDDDAIADPRALEAMLKHAGEMNVAALANIKLDIDRNPLLDHVGRFDLSGRSSGCVRPSQDLSVSPEIMEADFSSFVGIMPNADACRAVGPPLGKLFLHHDDVEFCMRLRKWGRILVVCDSVIVHKAAAGASAKVCNVRRFGIDSVRVPISQLARSFYGRRNSIWLTTRYGKTKLLILVRHLLLALRWSIGIAAFDDHKKERLGIIWGALWGGIFGKFDNTLPARTMNRTMQRLR